MEKLLTLKNNNYSPPSKGDGGVPEGVPPKKGSLPALEEKGQGQQGKGALNKAEIKKLHVSHDHSVRRDGSMAQQQ